MKQLSLLIFILIIISGCNKTENFVATPAINDYAPYEVGKYIVYKLDSFKFINFGTKDTVVSYQVKYQVDAKIKDNINRDAYRIVRFIRKKDSDSWQPENTFMAIPQQNSLEFVENNLRFINLALPIRDGFSWKGNSHIETYLNPELQFLDGWDFTYDSVGQASTIGQTELPNTLKVVQKELEQNGDPANPNTTYAEKNYSVEKYAKDIGLVFKDFVHWEYQRPTPQSQFYYQGYGITLTMIDHN